MSIQSEAERIKANVAATYAAAAELGAEMPDAQNSDNLAETVADAKAVLHTPQTLTNEQQAQARTNIGAASADEVSGLSKEIGDYETLTLGYGTDGKLYIFKNGATIGNGIEIAVSGDATCVIDEDNNLIISGAPNGSYMMKYLYEDGTYSDSISVVVSDVAEPEVMVNLIPTLQAPGLTGVYNDIGYKENTRQSISNGGDKTETGVTSTGLIEWISHDDVFHFRGITVDGSTDFDFCFTCYDSTGSLISTALGQMNVSCLGTDENGDATLQLRSDLISNFKSGTAYIRLVLGAVTGEFIMTRNQLITI